MGSLGIPTIPKDKRGLYKNFHYTNKNAVNNLIRYITRTRANEDRTGDLVCYGAAGAGYYCSPEDIIRQFLYVQHVYGIERKKGRRMYHEVFNLLDCEISPFYGDCMPLWIVGMKCCQVYYQMGFQAVFALHYEPGKRFHYHFAVNSINFLNGRKWHTSLEEIGQREWIFNQILVEEQRNVCSRISPIYSKGADGKDKDVSRSPVIYFSDWKMGNVKYF